MLDNVWQDFRYALRGVRRSPGFALTVAVTLALGIGANAAMFGIIDRLMFRPLAYLRDPDTVHRLYLQSWSRGELRTRTSAEYARYLDFRRWTASFSQLAAFSERPLAVGEGVAARERRVGAVSASFFTLFDARPALGRFFTQDEDATPRGADVAVLSYGFWQSEFGRRDVLGQILQVGNVRARIVGVAPERFAGVDDANPPAVYIPITTFAASTGTGDSKTFFSRYSWSWLSILARRKPEVSIEQASADASQAFYRSWEAQRALEPSLPLATVAKPAVVVSTVRPGAGPSPALEARTALWVTGVAGIVLLIACANVANLLLARSLRRQRETAVRLALGVSRGRLAMQSVVESLVLALIGSAAGLLVAQWGGAAIRRLLVSARGASLDVLTDWRTVGVTLGLTVAIGVITGLAPVLFATRGDLAHALRAGARGVLSQTSRMRGALLVAQGALSVVLLVGAGLFVRSLQRVEAMPMGYDAEHVVIVRRNLRGEWPGDSAVTALRHTLMSAARVIPGVEAAAWASSAPFISTSSTALYVAGIDSVSALGSFTYQATTPDYFRVMGTRILRGRALAEGDRRGAPPVAVISESMARALWPGREALGQCMRVFADSMPCSTIVGIAEDMVQRDIVDAQRYHYYLSIDQFTRTHGWGMLLKLRGDPAAEGERVRAALQRVMPGASYVTVEPLAQVVDEAQRAWRLGATMFVAFGALALIVAAVGLYGVIGYDVAQRMHELGVRVALGAQRTDVVRLVVARSLRFAVVGAAMGIGVALIAGPRLEPLLFHQSARDPLVYTVVGIVMLAAAIAASVHPALRAAGADPNRALRAE